MPAPTSGPWTSHGHPIDGLTVADRLPAPAKARCGCPGLCGVCSQDVERIRAERTPEPSGELGSIPITTQVILKSRAFRKLKAAEFEFELPIVVTPTGNGAVTVEAGSLNEHLAHKLREK
ncbi:hypothetical protein MUN78_10260 [Leucobacter allii]|uniref:Uncharacterized protein n=1 Tax=Leucobacter allii TaxID=2932247 RepID=A0ABY4FJH9_9MICO|nr:hypothetical protein [Leucobacter allii]UOQ56087.1 hypothetical protein MUN78_10260 [Leucobacter allii]